MRWTALSLALSSPAALAVEAHEISSLVGSAEKMGVVAVLLVALYVAGKEIIRGRGHAHKLRAGLVNCGIAREMWKTAYFATGAQPDTPAVKAMLDKEESLLKEENWK